MPAQVLIVGHPGLFPESLSIMLQQRHRDISVRQVKLPDEAHTLPPHMDETDLLIVTSLDFLTGPKEPLVSAIWNHKSAPPLLVLVGKQEADTASQMPSGLGKVVLLPKDRPLSVFLKAIRDTLDSCGVFLDGGQHTRVKLTGREREVFDALADGKSNKEIAQGLNIAPNTVRVHVSALLHKLSVRNRVEAAVLARQMASPDAAHAREA